jgi:hypothetical protein
VSTLVKRFRVIEHIEFASWLMAGFILAGSCFIVAFVSYLVAHRALVASLDEETRLDLRRLAGGAVPFRGWLSRSLKDDHGPIMMGEVSELEPGDLCRTPLHGWKEVVSVTPTKQERPLAMTRVVLFRDESFSERVSSASVAIRKRRVLSPTTGALTSTDQEGTPSNVHHHRRD